MRDPFNATLPPSVAASSAGVSSPQATLSAARTDACTPTASRPAEAAAANRESAPLVIATSSLADSSDSRHQPPRERDRLLARTRAQSERDEYGPLPNAVEGAGRTRVGAIAEALYRLESAAGQASPRDADARFDRRFCLIGVLPFGRGGEQRFLLPRCARQPSEQRLHAAGRVGLRLGLLFRELRERISHAARA